MMAWSAKPDRPISLKEGIRQIKSRLTNDIFRDEMLHLYEQKSASRDELVWQARRMDAGAVAGDAAVCATTEAEQLMQGCGGGGNGQRKEVYGYLPKRLKGLVDEIVDQMERLPIVRQCYDQWLLLRKGGRLLPRYARGGSLLSRKRVPANQNAVIREAERTASG